MNGHGPLRSSSEKDLLDACIGWHVRPHREAIVAGLRAVSPDCRFDGMRIVEPGATGRSVLSPYLASRGAVCMSSCYDESELAALSEGVSARCDRYGVDASRIVVGTGDVFNPGPDMRGDLVILKDVFGGLDRAHDMACFGHAFECCLSMLEPGGRLLIVDKGRATLPARVALERFGAAGRNAWHYFSRAELLSIAGNAAAMESFHAAGVLSFADFGGKVLQRVADTLDMALLDRIVPVGFRSVFSALFVKK